jgi:hypothetical protein
MSALPFLSAYRKPFVRDRQRGVNRAQASHARTHERQRSSARRAVACSSQRNGLFSDTGKWVE